MIKGLQAEWGMCSHIVLFDHIPQVLACWKNTVAVGLQSCDHNIVILDATTGSQTSVFSKHTDWVRSLMFSLDGRLLVSGGDDRTINLWDVQTGGVTQTFLGHYSSITSVSISPDCTMVISGSWDGQIHLWDVLTGEHHYMISLHNQKVTTVSFSPMDPQYLISASEDGTVRHWNINDKGGGLMYIGNYVVFSSDGAQLMSCGGTTITVRRSDSGAIVANLCASSGDFNSCCFSPNDKFVIGSSGKTIYIWDISSSGPHLIKTFTGHTSLINSLIFFSPASLISASEDQSIKFWEITMSSMDSAVTNPMSTPLTSASIESINVQASDGVVISSDSTGFVRVWDILTGHCKGPFKTPANGRRDTQLMANGLIIAWYGWEIGTPGRIHVWDVEKAKLLRTIGRCWSRCLDLRISGDGSKIFILDHQSIQAWSMLTGDAIGNVKLEKQQLQGSLIVNGSRVWLSGANPTAWDFGDQGSSPVILPSISPDRSRFSFLGQTTQNQTRSPRIEVDGRLVLCLPEKFAKFSTGPQWDKQYLAIGYHSGEVLILDFSCVLSE